MEQIQGDRAAAETLFDLIETLNLLAHLGEYETLVQGLAALDQKFVRDMALILVILPRPGDIGQARQEFMQEVFPADARSL